MSATMQGSAVGNLPPLDEDLYRRRRRARGLHEDVTSFWFLLPILSVVSQIFMQKLTMKSSPMDPSQAGSQKMMIYVMTFMSLYFCASYNSAFALYWVVSNIYAIVEQICFNKYFEQQDRKAAKAEEVGI